MASTLVRRVLRRMFWLFNRVFMVPCFRLGMGAWMGNPVTGYIMVLKTTGRKSGRVRLTPLNYAIYRGSVYCIAGWGEGAHWFGNALAHPDCEVILPGGPAAVRAERVAEPAEFTTVLRQILINGGFAGFFLGFNPHTASDAVLTEQTAGLPMLRLRPAGIGSGAGDPGGWMWIVALAVTVAVVWALLR